MTPAAVREQLLARGYAAAWSGVRRLPAGVAGGLFRAGADVAARRRGRGTERLRSNLSRVVPDADLDRLVRDALRSYARYWLEVFRLPVLTAEQVLAGTELHGRDVLDAALGSGRGVVLALPHSGNWDAAGAWLVASGHRFTTVAERLRPESLFDRFVAFRESLGMEVLPLTGGARPVAAVLRERLLAGGVLCLLGDRDLTPRGVEVDFFGGRARMPAGPAALSLATGAVLVPVSLWFTAAGWGVRCHPAVPASDVRTMTQDLARCFEKGIAEHPQDWHMLQRLWLDDTPGGAAR